MTLTENLNRLMSIAANIDHINGSLINHLKGTYQLLKSWGAKDELCIAGLYHALYGTSGFDNHLITVNHRNEAKEILGNNLS